MRTRLLVLLSLAAAVTFLAACGGSDPEQQPAGSEIPEDHPLLSTYTEFRLTADLSHLSANQRQIVSLLIEACKAMDEAFWIQSYGNSEDLLSSIEDPALRRYAEINYGPWDRLDDNEPFIEGVSPRPPGANLYPANITAQEFDTAVNEADEARAEALVSEYTMIRRAEDGSLTPIPYSEFFAVQIAGATAKLEQAAALAEDPGFKRYLELRIEALRTDNYRLSDMAWMEMKDNAIDVVIGPIEHYEDGLFNYKTAFEGYVLIKDMEWSRRLTEYARLLPELQRGLPVPDEYKPELPGEESDLNAYDAVYYAGDCNAGAKTLAINLPNDEVVQVQKGARRLQLKNSMQAKFDKILTPIAGMLIAEEQRANVTFDAFFANTMFHEVAHGLGIKETITGRGSVRDAMKEIGSAVEEGKADVLGLYLVTKLHDMGELGDAELMDNYVTFISSIFRSVRFGGASAHGRANLARFNYFAEQGAFARDEASGTYRIDFEKMQEAMNSLSRKILLLQGDGDYEGAVELMDAYGKLTPQLEADLARVNEAGIPVDIVFEQGKDVLGL